MGGSGLPAWRQTDPPPLPHYTYPGGDGELLTQHSYLHPHHASQYRYSMDADGNVYAAAPPPPPQQHLAAYHQLHPYSEAVARAPVLSRTASLPPPPPVFVAPGSGLAYYPASGGVGEQQRLQLSSGAGTGLYHDEQPQLQLQPPPHFYSSEDAQSVPYPPTSSSRSLTGLGRSRTAPPGSMDGPAAAASSHRQYVVEQQQQQLLLLQQRQQQQQQLDSDTFYVSSTSPELGGVRRAADGTLLGPGGHVLPSPEDAERAFRAYLASVGQAPPPLEASAKAKGGGGGLLRALSFRAPGKGRSKPPAGQAASADGVGEVVTGYEGAQWGSGHAAAPPSKRSGGLLRFLSRKSVFSSAS